MSTQSAIGTYPALEPVLSAIAHWVTTYRNARETGDQIRRCGPDEVAGIAHDLGVTPGELARLGSKGAGSADLLQKLLGALGVDAKGLSSSDPATMRDLQRLCTTCGHKSQCEHDLAAGSAARNYSSYCPNAYTLDALVKKSH
jgi:hypothetical protein